MNSGSWLASEQVVSEASWAGRPAWPGHPHSVSPLDTQQQAWAAAAQAARPGPRRTNRPPASELNISMARNLAQSRLWFRERLILTQE
jgi:hypothetical protein